VTGRVTGHKALREGEKGFTGTSRAHRVLRDPESFEEPRLGLQGEGFPAQRLAPRGEIGEIHVAGEILFPEPGIKVRPFDPLVLEITAHRTSGAARIDPGGGRGPVVDRQDRALLPLR
jgi:hypothetical protein